MSVTISTAATDVARLLLETGLRLGEALSLDWRQVRLDPAQGARFGFLTILVAKSKAKRARNIPLSARAQEVLRRLQPKLEGLVFTKPNGAALNSSHLGHQHKRLRDRLSLPEDFVLHSLRHTFGTRLGESEADAFSIMKLMGHSTVTVSQRYIHPSPEAIELAFARFAGVVMREVGTISGTPAGGEATSVQ